MVKRSAGALLVRGERHDPQVLLGHPGGPFFARKDDGAWSIPKGEYEPDEDPRAAAAREFAEELGGPLPDGEEWDLGEARASSGKWVRVFAVRADFDVTGMQSNTFELEWPPRSGRIQTFPELDRAEWFDLETARRKITKGQLPFLDRLVTAIGGEENE